jgi:hypothetical protein
VLLTPRARANNLIPYYRRDSPHISTSFSSDPSLNDMLYMQSQTQRMNLSYFIVSHNHNLFNDDRTILLKLKSIRTCLVSTSGSSPQTPQIIHHLGLTHSKQFYDFPNPSLKQFQHACQQCSEQRQLQQRWQVHTNDFL